MFSKIMPREARALVPMLFLLSAATGAVVVYFIPRSFYLALNQDITATVYAGILAFNAITLALSWSALAKILETITQKDFCSFLQRNGLLNSYRFYVEFIHAIQIAAAFITFTALIVLMIGNVIPDFVHQILLGATIAWTLYAMRWSHGAVHIANDLIIQYGKFDGMTDDDKKALKLAVSNGE